MPLLPESVLPGGRGLRCPTVDAELTSVRALVVCLLAVLKALGDGFSTAQLQSVYSSCHKTGPGQAAGGGFNRACRKDWAQHNSNGCAWRGVHTQGGT